MEQKDKGMKGKTCRICWSMCVETGLHFNGRALVRCAQCGVMQAEPFPSDEVIRSFYIHENFAREDGTRFKGLAETLSVFFRKKRAKLIQKLVRKQNAKILDVGTGRSVMLNELKKAGWEIYGTQPVKASSPQPNIYNGELSDAHYPSDFFDCVTLFHVLEHLAAPKETLREIFRVLKPDGILVIELPNAAALVPRLFKTCWFGYNVPEHLYHFTPQSLKHILTEEGFAVVKENFFSLEYSPFVLLQTLFNFLFHDDGNFFRSMREKKGEQMVSLPLKIMYGVLAVSFSFPCLIFSYFSGILKRGDIMTFYCEKQ